MGLVVTVMMAMAVLIAGSDHLRCASVMVIIANYDDGCDDCGIGLFKS